MMEQVSLGPVSHSSGSPQTGKFSKKGNVKIHLPTPPLLSHSKPSGQIPTKPTEAQRSGWAKFPNGQWRKSLSWL